MAAELYNTSPVFRMSFERCERLLNKLYGISVTNVLWDSKDSEELSRTLYSQTSIFCVEYSLFKLWESWGVTPDFVLGHSLGEFAAAVAAGVLTLEEALHLVTERSRLIDALPRGKMIVVKADKGTVQKVLTEFTSVNEGTWLDYAALNSFDQTVLAGNTETVEAFAIFCEGNGLKTIILAATHAFHSRHMDAMLENYHNIASAKLKRGNNQVKSQCEYVSGMEGKLIEKEELLNPEYWTKHTREKVSFIEACKAVQTEGCTLFLEIGPHPILCALAMANIDGAGVTCFPSLRRKQNDWATILESVGKLYLSEWNGEINWKGLDEYYARRKVCLPAYSFNKKKIFTEINPVPTVFHPLLGYIIENASIVTLFQNNLTLKKAPYLKDHVIGTSIVFPGAGFLEILLASGHSHVQCLTEEFVLPKRPVVLKDLKIESPLGLDDSKSTLLQTVVDISKEDSENNNSMTGYQTKVFHWHKAIEDSSSGHWVTHASAVYLPLVANEGIVDMEEVNLKQLQEEWEESPMSSDLYKRLPGKGVKRNLYKIRVEIGNF